MLVILVVFPILAGLGLWAAGDRRRQLRVVVSLATTTAMLGAAVSAAASRPSTTWRWGAGLEQRLEVADVSRAPVVLVAFVSLAVVAYALGYGEPRGRSRMVGLLLVFSGAMELLVVAGDFLTLVIAWELVGVVSWGLIAHHWRTDGPPNAAHAFLATRFGDLGLFAAAGAAFAASGSLDFAALDQVSGGWSHLLAAGVVLAAVAKSAQLPFSPWLFSAMAGPTPASALLHSATMVAAGAYLLARLQPVLDAVAWFAPTVVGIGLATALSGGVVAFLTPEAKKLLAASTSAHYGLMFVAVGAGYPTVAIAHLVAHGLFKALLFVSAGVAIDTAGTEQLVGMRLGRRAPVVAGLTAVGTLALAAVPPLGAAWTKEEIVAAGAHAVPWVGAAVVVAGGLSALYAARFQLVAYGTPPDQTKPSAARHDSGARQVFGRRPWALVALGLLAAASIALGVLWTSWGERRLLDIVAGELPTSATWELVASLAGIAIAIYAAVQADRHGRLAAPATTPALHHAGDWFGIATASRRLVADPTLWLARSAARFDDRVVDAIPRGVAGLGRRLAPVLAAGDDRFVDALPRGVSGLGRRLAPVLAAGDDRIVDAGVRGVARLGAWGARVFDRVGEWTFDGFVEGVARLTGAAGRDSRRLQTGMTHHYYAGIAAGLAALVLTAVLWS